MTVPRGTSCSRAATTRKSEPVVFTSAAPPFSSHHFPPHPFFHPRGTLFPRGSPLPPVEKGVFQSPISSLENGDWKMGVGGQSKRCLKHLFNIPFRPAHALDRLH